MKESTSQLLANSRETLEAAELLAGRGYLRDAASRAYYGAFYVAEALLNEKDLAFKKHGALHGAFAQEFIKTGLLDPKYHRYLLKAFNQRQLGDYDEGAQFALEDVAETIRQSQDFLAAALKYLG